MLEMLEILVLFRLFRLAELVLYRNVRNFSYQNPIIKKMLLFAGI